MKASPFKIADANTHVFSIIEQNNFTNESLHIISQQLDHIEEKIVEKTPVSKAEKPLIDLPSQDKKLKFKTSQAKTFDIVEKMLFDLKVKTNGTSTSTTYTISRNEKEIVSDENTDSDIVSSVSTRKVFDDDLPEIKRFVGNSKPMSFTKKWYSKPTPLICSLKKELFKCNSLFLLIKFMNRILMVCLNKKSLIKYVICLWLELLM